MAVSTEELSKALSSLEESIELHQHSKLNSSEQKAFRMLAFTDLNTALN